MEYRLLANDEKKKLFEIWPAYGGIELDSVPIAGAVDGQGRVRAFAVLNYVPHCEPVWIERGAPVDFRRLVRVIEEAVIGPELWIFAPNEHAARMAEICGAKDMHWKVMRKEL